MHGYYTMPCMQSTVFKEMASCRYTAGLSSIKIHNYPEAHILNISLYMAAIDIPSVQL